jgi:hypothetical protein
MRHLSYCVMCETYVWCACAEMFSHWFEGGCPRACDEDGDGVYAPA